jgi:predicted metal-binding membrane protein
MIHVHPIDSPVFRQDRTLVFAGLGVVAVAAWGYTAYLAWSMATMDHAAMPAVGAWRWTLGDVIAAFLMWTVMMTAMMLPAAALMIAMVATINRRRRERDEPYTPTAVFVAGYLLVWTGFSVLATGVQSVLHAASLLTPMMENAHPAFAGVLLVLAGLYQWMPFKQACLARCRSPLGFILTEWRDGTLGALVMGVRHGLFCVGCCWALMALLFAVSVMNLLWVATLAALVMAERVSRHGDWVRQLVGAGLVLVGIAAIVQSAV